MKPGTATRTVASGVRIETRTTGRARHTPLEHWALATTGNSNIKTKAIRIFLTTEFLMQQSIQASSR